MFNLSKQGEDNNFHNNMDYNTTSACQTNNFKKVFDDVTTNSLIQKFLTSNQIDDEILTIAPSQDYKPFGLFQDQHGEKLSYPTLFFGNHCVQCIPSHYTYQEITKWELMHKDHKCARYIPNLFFKVVKILIQAIHTNIMLDMDSQRETSWS
jgi:hypothetical protein